jgi:hypothetical protein
MGRRKLYRRELLLWTQSAVHGMHLERLCSAPAALYLAHAKVQFFFFLKSFGNADRHIGSSDLPCVPTRGEINRCRRVARFHYIFVFVRRGNGKKEIKIFDKESMKLILLASNVASSV